MVAAAQVSNLFGLAGPRFSPTLRAGVMFVNAATVEAETLRPSVVWAPAATARATPASGPMTTYTEWKSYLARPAPC